MRGEGGACCEDTAGWRSGVVFSSGMSSMDSAEFEMPLVIPPL